jgi:prepilin-type N-terminal cleavage/methylation domain-containing protein
MRPISVTRRTDLGFTLVEMIIALVLTGLVATAVVSLLVGQGAFYSHSDDGIYAGQTVRAGVDLMSAELRMASPTDLTLAEADSVTVRFDVFRAVVCDSTGADEAALFVFDSASANLAGGSVGTAYSGPYEQQYEYADGWLPTGGASGGAVKTICTGNGAPADAPDANYVKATGWSGNFTGGVPDRASLVRVYGRLTYSFGTAADGTGTALWRGAQELAEPFASGASLSYVMADGSVVSSASGSDLADVRAIRISASALGGEPNRFAVTRDLSFDIPLRN